MKKRSFIAAFLLLATYCLHAQVFVGAQYSSLSSDNWKYVREDVETLENAIFTSGFSANLGYEIPLIRTRITSLAPAIGYSSFRRRIQHPNSGQSAEFALTCPSLEVFVVHYPFDNRSQSFGATKLKTAPVFRKGFFVAGGLGFRMLNTTLGYEEFNVVTQQFKPVKGAYDQTAWSFGFRTGFDFGISRRLTLSPVAGISWLTGLNGTDFFIPDRGVASNSIFLTVDEDDARSALMFSAGLNLKVHFGD